MSTKVFEVEKFAEAFEKAPDIEQITRLKKTELLEVAKHYGVATKAVMKKSEVRNILVKYFVDEELLPESCLETITEPSSLSDIKKLELEHEFRLKKLDMEEREKEREERERKAEREREERERQAEREREERERQAEREERKRQVEVEHEVKLKELELEALKVAPPPPLPPKIGFDASRHVRLVPPFQEKEVDKYFLHFEKVAQSMKWPVESWTLLLQSVLKGKAQEVYSALSVEQSRVYETVKGIILKAYELVPEAYRQRFRNCKKQESQTYVEFGREKEVLFDRWCSSREVNEDYGRLRQLLLVEEFKRCLSGDLKTHLDEQKVNDLQEAASVADNYALTHKAFRKVSQQFPSKRGFVYQGKSPSSVSQEGTGTPSVSQSSGVKKGVSYSSGQQGLDFSSKSFCAYCKKPGHIISECYTLQRKNKAKASSNALTVGRSQVIKVSKPEVGEVKQTTFDVQEGYKPFMSEGFVSLNGDVASLQPITILRDTGASQSLILEGILPLSEKTSIGASVLVQGVECGFVEVPLHSLNLKSDLVSGSVIVGVRPSLPVEGVSFLLGNDLAGGKVTIVPCVVKEPSISNTKSMEEEFPGLFPACAVTRAMAKKLKENSEDEVDLSDTFLGQSGAIETPQVEDSVGQSGAIETPQVEDSVGQSDKPVLGRESFRVAQSKDPELVVLGKGAVSETEAATLPACYFYQSGVLLRKWRPPDAPVDEDWRVVYQIVVPTVYREEILSLAHDSPMSGHLGVNKTYDRILRHFFWPGLRRDVAEYCKTCHTCQMVGKPNQRVPKAPLKPIPAFEEPFSRVIIDCVGPLPKSKSGNRFLLTIMCASTRFPEAIPLRKITAPVVVRALIKFFTLVGLPESQGVLERFHQTLKTMIKTYCFGNEKDWDEGVPLLLFAVREVAQDSLGFSPFELVFGHQVRGPLKVLKEHLMDKTEESHLLEYVSSFRERLHKACDMAKENLAVAQGKMKSWCDKRTKQRYFQKGDKVLVLLPVLGQPFQSKYYGPYIIDRKINAVDYVVNTPGRRKQRQLCHINMLKEYHERASVGKTEVAVTAVVGCIVQEENEVEDCEGSLGGGTIKLQNSDVLANLTDKLGHLPSGEQVQLTDLIVGYRHLFSDVPGRADCVQHDVDVGEASPIKQHPYRVNRLKLMQIQKEVDYMLENDFVEFSNSEWSSPCLLVPKPDKTVRFCTDYRKVNSVTRTDSYPIPRVDDCIDQVGSARYVSKFDLLKGYWQVPLTERAKQISAFVTPNGLYQYKVMPFGMKNSPATFQRLINWVIQGLEGCAAYIDDVVICSKSWLEHVEQIQAFFDRLTQAKLTVNLKKSEFGKAQVVFLGHVVGQGQVRPVQAKVEAIVNFSVPTTKRELMRFLGMAGFYRKYCKNFSDVASPLTNLLSKKVDFLWSEECSRAFCQVKAVLMNSPVLMAPRIDHPFKLAVDASDTGAGAALLQEDSQGIEHPVCYFSKKFSKCQRNYSTIEKEALAMVLALQHFEVYVGSTTGPVVVYTDHNPLTFLSRVRNKNQRLLRWSLFLQEYNLDIKHVKGRDNVVADALSRVN